MAALAAGTILADTYQLLGPIGRGGMGVVWRARHLRLPREVAIKVMSPHGDERADADGFARFRHEAEIVARLGHPNIVHVLDFNTLEGFGPYIVMELLEGESLHARLGRGPLPPAEVLAIVRQLAPALDAAHRLGVVHRDLKPENLFLTAEPPLAKVLDFGVSKIRGSNTVRTHNDVMLGTPQYMAPEQASGDNGELDQRADLFALAAIVFEMLVGEPAFAGDNLAAITYKIVHGQTPRLAARAPWLPASVVAAVERGLAKSREQRFADVPSFVAALAELATTAPGPIRAAPVASRDSAATAVARPRLPSPAAGAPPAPRRLQRHWPMLAFLLAVGGGAIVLALATPPLRVTADTTIELAPGQVTRTPGPGSAPTPAPRLLPPAAVPPVAVTLPRAVPVASTPTVATLPPPVADPVPVAPRPVRRPAAVPPAARPAPEAPAAPPKTAPVAATPAVVATPPEPKAPAIAAVPPQPGALSLLAWTAKVQKQLGAMTSLESCVTAVHAVAPAAVSASFDDDFEFAHGRMVSVRAELWQHLNGRDDVVELYDQLSYARARALMAEVGACVTRKLAEVQFPPIDEHTIKARISHFTRLR